MSEREEERGGAGVAFGCLLMLLFGPVLYVLSIGPAQWLVDDNDSLQWVSWIYYPLELLGGICPPFDDTMIWYIDLWT